MSEVAYLSLEDAHDLISLLDVGPVRDEGLLDSALARPRASAFGVDAYPDLATKAAALFQSLVKNHALVDGNKRLTWSATFIFAHINGLEPSISQDDAFELVLEAAGGALELAEIARRLGLRPRRAERSDGRG